MYTNTCVQSCTLSSQRQRQHGCVSLWLWDGEKERGSSCWWFRGWGGRWTEPLQRHTDRSLWKERITCASLLSCHILIPRLGPFGNQLTPLHPAQSPTAEPPPPGHSGLQLSALPPLYCSSLVSGTHSQTHTHTHTFTKATPTTGLPHVCQEHQVGWREDGGLTL